jgi:ribulose 1,5-bisphosphate synthetase/thiazole synthase
LLKVGYCIAAGGKNADGGFRIIIHEATIAFDGGAENGGELMFKTFICHRAPPKLRFQTNELSMRIYQRNSVSDEQQDSIQQIENRFRSDGMVAKKLFIRIYNQIEWV